eukprot:7870484-Ditylum_brightwellii.AAC.1
MRKQVKRLRMARHLLNAWQLLPNTCFPRKPTRRRKIHFPCTGWSNRHEDCLQGGHQCAGRLSPVSVEVGV